MGHKSSENIAAALKLLEEAAEQKKDELKAAMSDKYTNLRSLIMEKDSGLMDLMGSAKDQAFDSADRIKEAGIEKAHAIARDVDRDVHRNPWLYLAGAAVAGVLFGFILHRSPK